MAVVTVTVADSEPTPQRWEMPPNPLVGRSPVPQGLLTYSGTDAIATLTAGSQTVYKLTLSLPPGFAYLPRIMLVLYSSDDTGQSWDADGFAKYLRPSIGSSSSGAIGNTIFTMHSQGAFTASATNATQLWTPGTGAPKLIIHGDDTLQVNLTDMDAAAAGQAAGDMSYWIEMYVFNIDQIDKWEVNTPIPTISHTAF